jgi:glutamate synthase (NADPH) small chain
VGKAGGFLEFGRKDPGYRPREERVRDFRSVDLKLGAEEIKRQAARCMDCGTPFCHGCGCTLTNVIPELNDLVYHRRWKEAYELLASTSNFPEITARVCPALCEAACVLGINDEPVSIRQLELAIMDAAFEAGLVQASVPERRLDGRLAVIGSGPAGLAVADTVNRHGYRVTVFERGKQPGGILRYGIPDFKLEKDIIDRRIRLLQAEGIAFECGVTAGDDISCHYLQERFDAICLAAGSREPRDLKVPGRELKGIHFAMEFLTQQNQKLAGETIPRGSEISAQGRNVVVIGGGDTGSDCVGTAIRQGAKKVFQFEILPKPPEKRGSNTPWPQWPLILRETSSHKEGCERRWCVNTTEFSGKTNIERLRCVEVEWHPDAAGRLSFHAKPGTEFEIEASIVLLALGFTGPGPNPLADQLGVARDQRGSIQVDVHHNTNVSSIFAAGDMARGQSLVVRAIADGRACGLDIVEYLNARERINDELHMQSGE